MVTILVYLEKGYESTFEHLAFRQLKGAWHCNLICVGQDCDTVEEALDSAVGTRVFLLPPDRHEDSIELEEYTAPEGDVVYIFGRPGENMVRYIREEDLSVKITTPGESDMMSITVAGVVLYNATHKAKEAKEKDYECR